MRTTSLLLLFACLSSGAQVIMSGTGSKHGVQFRYETRVEPEIPGLKLSGFDGGGLVAGAGFHRFIADRTARKYYGYDLLIEPQGEGFRVAMQPLSLSAEKLGLKGPGEWSPLPLPPLPAPMTVRPGAVIALDLFVHPRTKQKIVDYLFIQDGTSPWQPKGPPRDFAVEDAPITISKFKLSVNGKKDAEWDGAMSGTFVYLYLPDRGRFVFSLAPNRQDGFRRAGEVRGGMLRYEWNGDTFEMQCGDPVAPGGGVFHLYVHHDPSWRPRSGGESFQLGAQAGGSLVGR